MRSVNSHYEIVAGHHRAEAVNRAGFTAIPCWVAELTDEEAFMQLVLSNAQSELSPLEIGVHALEAVPSEQGKGGGGLQAYADQIGKSRQYVSQVRQAAGVLKEIKSVTSQLKLRNFLDKAKHLAAIHLAPEDTWALLVEHLLSDQWAVKDTEAAVKRVKDLLEVIPDWWTVDRLSVAGLAVIGGPHGLKGMFELAGELAEKLRVVTIYQHKETDVTEIRNGREYRRLDPVAEEYDGGVKKREGEVPQPKCLDFPPPDLNPWDYAWSANAERRHLAPGDLAVQ